MVVLDKNWGGLNRSWTGWTVAKYRVYSHSLCHVWRRS